MKTQIPHPPRGLFFGEYGGQYVPESLKSALEQLTREFETAWADDAFHAEYEQCLREIAGRPSELYFAKRLTEKIGGAKIYLKREDMNHTGAHKINNTLGQALLTKRMGKTRVIAETGAGQHGVATATAAAVFGLECEIFMGAEDIRRQALNVFRMELLGTKVTPVERGQKTLSDAVDAAIENWLETYEDTHYVLGSVCGPHPFPLMVREFQKIIGIEARAQMLEMEGRLPDLLVACVGGGSNAAGLFTAMIDDESVQMLGVEAGGRSMSLGENAATLTLGKPGVLHGSKCYVVQDEDGNTAPVHSVAAGLDYPGVGPEHSYWKDTGRVKYTFCNDVEAIDALIALSHTEGIIPALESSHAVAEAMKQAAAMSKDSILLVNLSGRGDKDCKEIEEILARRQ